MKIKHILTFLISIISLQASAQSIYSVLQHDRGIDLRNEPLVREVTVRTTFYNGESTNTKKDIILVNSKHKTLSETRFNIEGQLESRLTKKFDSTETRSLTRKFERWHPLMGYSFETAHYSYDKSGYLIKIQDKNQVDTVFQETTITNNTKGAPIELKVSIYNSEQLGIEIASYDYPNNRAVTKVISNTGAIISESSITIDFSVQMKNNIYNEFGDLIKSANSEYEYKYDKQSNWIRKTIYKIIDGKRTKYQIIKRKIKYSK
jgi:hypothetical protein